MKSKASFFVLVVCILMTTNANAYVRHGGRTNVQHPKPMTTLSHRLQQYVGIRLVDGPRSTASAYGEDIKFDNYMGIAAAYGIKYNSFRGEIEFKTTTESKYNENYYDYYYSYNDDLLMRYTNLMLNAYYDINIINGVSVYLMGGLGIEHINEKLKWIDSYEYIEDKYDVTGEDKYDVTGFAYQLGFGISYTAYNNIALDLGYRYISAPNIDESCTVSNHELLFGARYMF